jgi:RNA polymerase sigma-70 factor (ECF subfamily)
MAMIVHSMDAETERMSLADRHSGGPLHRQFPTTRWSLIIATRQRPTTEAKDALAHLCASYWYPLYAFARRWSAQIEGAQDLTQGFFACLLEKEYLKDFDRERGRFRAFLLTAFRHFIANERDRERAQKRGGGQIPISLDMQEAERRYLIEPIHDLTPEKLYERSWATTLLDRVLERLRRSCSNLSQFDRLRVFLTGEPRGKSYSELASELGMSEGALKIAVHRLRRKFRKVLLAEIADTVASPEEVREEIQYLLSVVSG